MILTMNIMNWGKYFRQKCKEWLEENKKSSVIEYETFSKKIDEDKDKDKDKDKDTDKDKQIVSYSQTIKSSEDLIKGAKLYGRKKNIETLYNYFDIGYFDILEFSNNKIILAINPVKEMIVDIKNI